MTNFIDHFLKTTMGSLLGSSTPTDASPYSKRLSSYAKLSTYQNIFEVNKLKRPVSSDIEVKYSNKIHFGCSKEQVTSTMNSKPVEALFNTHNLNRNILLFSEKHGKHEVLVEAHFHQDKLFFFKCMFPEANPELRNLLLKELISEYQLPSIDLTLHSIYDNKNNCIQIRDLNTFEIVYTSLENPFFDKLVKRIAQTNNQLLADYQLTSAPQISKKIVL